MKKYFAIMSVLVLALPMMVLAGVTKYTFADVDLNGQTGEVEAVVKDTPKNDFTRCDYYSDGYVEWLGFYKEPVATGPGAADVEAFCVAHFDDRMM